MIRRESSRQDKFKTGSGLAACLTCLATSNHERIWQGKQYFRCSSQQSAHIKKLGFTRHKPVLSAELHTAPQARAVFLSSNESANDVAGLTYVGTHIHNNIMVPDLDPILQVALLFHNLSVDEKSFNMGLRWHRPTIGQFHSALQSQRVSCCPAS